MALQIPRNDKGASKSVPLSSKPFRLCFTRCFRCRPPLCHTFSDSKLDPTYASVSVRVSGRGEMEVVAEAHRILSEGVLSGYELNPARPSSRSDPEMDSSDTGVDDVSFVDDATVAADVGSDWKGTISTEELPGGGLHRHVSLQLCYFPIANLAFGDIEPCGSFLAATIDRPAFCSWTL